MTNYKQQIKTWAQRRQMIAKRSAKGESGASIARSLGVSRAAINRALKKESFAK